MTRWLLVGLLLGGCTLAREVGSVRREQADVVREAVDNAYCIQVWPVFFIVVGSADTVVEVSGMRCRIRGANVPEHCP